MLNKFNKIRSDLFYFFVSLIHKTNKPNDATHIVDRGFGIDSHDRLE